MLDEWDEDEAHMAEWHGDYNGEDCEKCGRERVIAASNGKRVCEKCRWCPEDQKYIPERLHY